MNNNNFQSNENPQNIPPQPINNPVPNPINDAINLGNLQAGLNNQTPIENNNSPIDIPTNNQNQPGINVQPTPNNFINPNNIQQNNNPTFSETLESEGIHLGNNSKFISNEAQFNETTINDLNVDGTYNNMGTPDYSQDPKVKENLEKINSGKKTTVQLPADSKTFIIIAIVLLIFILVMPYIFDLIRNIKY